MKIIFSKLYRLFIAPRQRNEDDRNRELVLNVLLSCTLLALLLSLPIFLYNYFIVQKTFALGRMFWIVLIIGLVAGLHRLSRIKRYKLSALLLVSVYFLMATVVIMQWGITTPMGLLLYGLVIVLSSILLGPRHSLYAAAAVISVLFGVHFATGNGTLQPDLTWTVAQPEIGDAIAFSIIFSLIAVVSWLFNRQMELSLKRAERAERALTKQKDLLESTVQQRTQELQTVQLEKIRQMYRFAELGQLSTALLHDLANHLTTLTLDIEGLEGQTRSRALGRAKRSIKYIDEMVVRVRDQLHGKSTSRPFDAQSEIKEVVKMLRHKAMAFDVLLKLDLPETKQGLRIRGEPIRFRQLMANLISNGIDAYYEPRSLEEKRDVKIEVEARRHNMVIRVTDWGRGIPDKDRHKLFEAFYSTKQTGMGMGLYIARQVAEEHFLGSLELDNSTEYTSFVLTVPKADE